MRDISIISQIINDMENTERNKKLLFAQYFGQEVIINNINNSKGFNLLDFVRDYHLLLKPLSSITDDDAFDYAKNYLSWTDPEQYKNWFLGEGCQIKGSRHADYLRSKGYATPYLGLTVEKQIEFVWIKLKSE